MNIIVTGSLGNVGRPLTEDLIKKGHQVTVISSKEDRKKDIEAMGAKAAIGSLQDAAFLSSAFEGADAVFAMVPPNFSVPDMRAYYREIANNYVKAAQQAGVRRIVQLSSWGADLDKGTGFILGSHDAEGILDGMQDVSITHLRAGSFYYNVYAFKDMIKGAGFIGTNYGGDDKIAWVHPTDIAAAAAEELEKTTGDKVRYIVSDERTAGETAQALGTAIGKPDLKWITFTNEQAKEGMAKSGMPLHIVSDFVDLGASIHNGTLGMDYEKHKPALGKVKLEDFAKEFAATFN